MNNFEEKKLLTELRTNTFLIFRKIKKSKKKMTNAHNTITIT